MAKDEGKKEKEATEKQETAQQTEQSQQPAAAQQQPGAQQPVAQQTIRVDDSGVAASYANFCRVSSTPEELILDLALNPNPFATGDVTLKVSQRIIMNHYTAKRLLGALSAAIQRHEQVFGVLETDVRKRVIT
ncbi:MAG: DUF3467 domain-containing protein [Planctomycetes bacterium]|nr:DUF3467 domain-containing protein [Planctomycetota bacterium]